MEENVSPPFLPPPPPTKILSDLSPLFKQRGEKKGGGELWYVFPTELNVSFSQKSIEFWFLYHVFHRLFIQAINTQVHFEFGYPLFDFDREGFIYNKGKIHTQVLISCFS